MFVPFIIALFMNQVVKIDEGQFQLLKSMTEQACYEWKRSIGVVVTLSSVDTL